MAAPDTAAAEALETLASLFARRDYNTALITGRNRPPRLAIARRHGALTDDIHACDGWYWRACAERIAPLSDPHAAAAAIASTLGASLHSGVARTPRRRV
jgi:hypothetical protein